MSSTPALAQVAGCELLPRPNDPTFPAKLNKLIADHGLKPFLNPDEVRPTSVDNPYVIRVTAAKNVLAGCPVTLRSYNGGLVGNTIRAKPGDTIYVKLINELVSGELEATPVQHPQGVELNSNFSFNITNLHTHGLHTSPRDDGDNVFIELRPRASAASPPSEQLYKFHIHEQHPAGTFWYHAHIHGSTAVQLASGMAGALIIDDGTKENGDLDAVQEIAAAKSKEKILVIQQFAYDFNGEIRKFDEQLMFRRRPTMINGQLVPEIIMRPGEVQRWRIIHAGTIENISLALDGHALHEVAADGISLGRIASWPEVVHAGSGGKPIFILGPGYRTDVLVKAQPLPAGELRKEYYLRDLRLPPRLSIQAGQARFQRSASADSLLFPMEAAGLVEIEKPEQVLARIVVEGPPVTMNLPKGETLTEVKPKDLNDIDKTITATVKAHFGMGRYRCDINGKCVRCEDADTDTACKPRLVLNNQVFMHGDSGHGLITQTIGAAAKWELKGEVMPHPFHIHVNPFQTWRDEIDPSGKVVSRRLWKDTILVLPDDPGTTNILTRYTRFTGKFVLHCHILTHEDKGMMQAVEVVTTE